MTRQKVVGQLQDVFLALPQRRHSNIDSAQPVIQVRSEQAALGQCRQRPIGRRHDACVDALGAAAADALDHQVLDRAEQLRLRSHRQLGHLVEKQRAAVGMLELASPASHAGRRPLFDAKQLGLDQRLDERGAIDGDERTLPAAAELVNLARDQLLAGPALAFDQYREIRGRDPLDTFAQALHHQTRADERRSAITRGPRAVIVPARQSFGLEYQVARLAAASSS